MTQLSKSFAIYTRNQLSAAADLALKLGLTVPSEDDLPDMLELPEDNVVAGLDMDEDLSSFFEKTTSGLVQDALAAFKGEATNETSQEGAPTNANGVDGDTESAANAEAPARTTARSDYEELEALVAQSTSDYVKNTLNSMSPMSYVPQTTGKFPSKHNARILINKARRWRYLSIILPQPPTTQPRSTPILPVLSAAA